MQMNSQLYLMKWSTLNFNIFDTDFVCDVFSSES